MGYGSSETAVKVFKRTYIAVFVVGCGLVFCFLFGGKCWMILPLHLGIALGTVWLGVKSIIPASAEEFVVSMMLNFGLILYPFAI